MTDIKIHLFNYSKIVIQTENPRIQKELNSVFSVYADGYRFTPKYKQGIWDGKIKFIKNGIIPIGLTDKLIEYAKKGNYNLQFEFDLEDKNLQFETFKEFIDEISVNLPPEIEVRDYQIQAAFDVIKHYRRSIDAKTASGKSLIQYFILRWLIENDNKCLLIVPRINLVHQMFNDFINYGWEEIRDVATIIHGGLAKDFNKQLIITTWQSVFKEKELFAEFDCLMIDEAHGAKATSVANIADNCINALYRCGLSGTFPANKESASWYTITGALGQPFQYTSYKDLEEYGYIAKSKIIGLVLRYPEEERKKMYNCSLKDFHHEKEELQKNELRNKFIAKTVLEKENNSIILFTNIEKQGKLLKKQIEELNDLRAEKDKKRILYIDGSVKVEDREHVKHIMENNNNVILLASYGTFAEGANIKNIHNVFLASSYKTEQKVLQPIGRGIRKLGDKLLRVYDVVDDMSIKFPKDIYINYALKHYKDRKKIYKEHQFNFVEIFVDL